jgi:hypothetical protein
MGEVPVDDALVGLYLHGTTNSLPRNIGVSIDRKSNVNLQREPSEDM